MKSIKSCGVTTNTNNLTLINQFKLLITNGTNPRLNSKNNSTGDITSNHPLEHYAGRLKNCHSLLEVSVLLSDMLKKKCVPDKLIVNHIITRIKDFKQMNLALELGNIAVKNNIADADTYNLLIDAIAKSTESSADINLQRLNMERAMQLFNEAKNLGYADVLMYNSICGIIANSIEPDLIIVYTLFDEAKNLGYATTFIYNCFIHAIARNTSSIMKKYQPHELESNENIRNALINISTTNVNLALRILRTAKACGMDDALTYCCVIDVIANGVVPDKTLAKKLLHEAQSLGYHEHFMYAKVYQALSKRSEYLRPEQTASFNPCRLFVDTTRNNPNPTITSSAPPQTDYQTRNSKQKTLSVNAQPYVPLTNRK